MNKVLLERPAANRPWRPLLLAAVFLLLVALLLLTVPGTQAGPEVEKQAAAVDCRLLDDAGIRAKMSGMLETRLLLACGRAHELGQVQNEPIRPELVGVDVLVNDPAGDSGSSRTQSETSIARNETNGTLCSGYNDSYHGVTQGLGYTGFSSSTDGGASFTDHGPIGAGSFGDPSLIWRKVDGKFYIATLHSNGLGMYRSDNDCTTFTFISNPNTSGGDDKELLAVDNNVASPYYGRIYIAWIDFGAGSRIFVKYSTDGGVTWSSALAVSAAGADVQGAWPTVAPNGDVYVAWVRWNPYPSGPIDMEVVRSTNGGTSFTPVTNPLTGAVNPRDATATASCARPALKGNIRYLPSPQIVVSPNGHLHVVYAYDPDGYNTGDVINAFYRRSIDNGATWGPEVQLNDDGTITDQFFPTVSAGPSGRIVATWYDRRLDPANNTLFDYYMRISDDGGVNWRASERVSDVSSPVILDPNLATCYHGDYDQQIQDGGTGYIQWSDDRTVVLADPNIWFDKEPFAPDFTLTVTPASQDVCTPSNAVYNVDVGSILGYNDPVTLSASGNPAGTTANFSVNPVTPPGASVLTIGNTGAAAAGSYNIDVVGVAPTSTHTTTVQLNLFTAAPAAPTLVSPPNGATGVSTSAPLSWNAVANATSYTVEVATDAGFSNIVYSNTLAGTSDTATGLSVLTQYFWRVRAANACGAGTNSAVWGFTTNELYCNPATITIPNSGAGTPYPSNIAVSGSNPTLSDVNVHFTGLSHTWPDDIDIMVVGPAGQNLILLSDAGGSTDVNNADLIFDDAAAGTVPDAGPLTTGTYRPSNYEGSDTFPAPAPPPSAATQLAVFNGTNPNGTWSLYVVDDAGGDSGAIAGGWCLEIGAMANSDPTINSAAITSPIDENDTATLSGTFTDPDPGNTFALTVDWGDGSAPEVFNYPAGTTSFSEDHQYLDDDPTGTPSDDYDVDLLLEDNNGGSDSDAVQVTVNNVDPVVDAGADFTVYLGSAAAFNGSFTDPGTLDSHTIEWDFGDGNTASGSLTPSHTYADTGTYVVSLTVTDDDTGEDSDEVVVTVQPNTIFLPMVVNTSSSAAPGPTAGLLLLPAAVLGLLPLWRRRK